MVGVGSGILVGVGIGGDVLVGTGVEVGGISVNGSGVEVGAANCRDGVGLGGDWEVQDAKTNPRKRKAVPIFLSVMNTGFLRPY